MGLKEIAERAKKQAEAAAEQKRQSEMALAQAQADKKQKDESKKVKPPAPPTIAPAASVNTLESDLEKIKTTLGDKIHEHHKSHGEDPNKLHQTLIETNQRASDAFVRKSAPVKKPSQPWYGIFCCCIRPVSEEKEPLLRK